MKKIFLLPLNLKNKTEFLLSQINHLNLNQNFIYITSNFCKVQDFKLKFYNHFKNSFLPPTFTLKSFASKIVEEKSSKKIISDLEKFLIIFEIIKKEKKDFQLYSDEGFAKILTNFIKELKISSINGVKLSEIKKTVLNSSLRFENHKKNIEFAFNVFEKYEDYLKKKNLIDIEDIYNEALNHFEESYNSIIFENIVEIPNYQKNFIAKLINKAGTVIFSYYNPQFFSIDAQEFILKETLNFLKSITNWEIEEIDGERYNPEIECFNFPTKEEEIKGIVFLMEKEFENNKEIKIDDFLVTCPDMLNYRNYIKRIFSRFNLPVEIIPGYSFIFEPSISILFEFFIFSDTYEWNTLMNILTSPFLAKIDKKEVKKFSELTRNNYENIGFYKDDFEKLNDKNIEIIKNCLNLMKDKMTLSEWKNVLKKIIEITGWHTFEPEIKVEFEKLMDKMNGSYFLEKKEFINLLKKLLELIEVEGGTGEGIKVSGIIESLGIEKKICYFCGTTEENFPNSPKIEEFLLPDKLRKELGVDYFEKRIARDRCDFYRIKNEHEKIIFTFPSKVEDQLQMKSIFIFDIEPKEELTRNFLIETKNLFEVKIDKEKFKSQYIKDNKFTIGVSDLELLLKCPYKFYIKKVEKIKPYRIPEIRESPDIWGQIVHESIKCTFVEEKGKKINSQKLKEYTDRFKFFLDQKVNEYLSKNKISNIYKNIIQFRKEEVLNKFEEIIESSSDIKLLDLEKDIKFEDEKIIRGLVINGRVDILGEIDKKITIIDLKTGTSWNVTYTDESFFVQGNIQIPLYVWIYSNSFKIPYENIKAIIWNFSFIDDEKNKIIKEYDFSESKFNYMERIKEFLENLKEKILSEDISFIPANNKSECFICEYKELCIYAE